MSDELNLNSFIANSNLVVLVVERYSFNRMMALLLAMYNGSIDTFCIIFNNM